MALVSKLFGRRHGPRSITLEEIIPPPEEAIPQRYLLPSQPLNAPRGLPNNTQENELSTSFGTQASVGGNHEQVQLPGENLRILIKPSDCDDRLGYRWPSWKKWVYLSVIFAVQVSMNLNTTLYSNGIAGMAAAYGVSPFTVRWGGAASFLIAYAFGCELWAPWSEEYGRRIILQISLFLVNVWAVMAVVTPNWTIHVLARTLGGLCSAGGSVTLAVITDMYEPNDPMFQYATSFIVLASVGGSIIGPIFGGMVEAYLQWQWCIWIQLILGVFVQILHLFIMPETRATIIMDEVAKTYRTSGKNSHLYGPNEINGKRCIDWLEVRNIWMRPFRMLVTEPIVLVFSLLSGVSDAIIFMNVQSFSFVYWQWRFGPVKLGLAFIPIALGYIVAYIMYFFFIKRNVALRKKNPTCQRAQYESRLQFLLVTAPLLPLGLLIFAFTGAFRQPPVHWIGSMVGSFLVGIGNYSIYMATIDYVLRAYGPYAASATGGNGWARDFLAGILTPYAIPLYENLSIFTATIALFVVATVLCGLLGLVYMKGELLRRSSKFAQTLIEAAADQSNSGNDPGADTAGLNRMVNFLPAESLAGSRAASRAPSIAGTPAVSRRTSIQMPRLERCPNHGQYSHQTQGSQHIPIAVVEAPEAESSTSVDKPCDSCSSGRTLVGSCGKCSGRASSAQYGEGSSPPTSLSEVEEAGLGPELRRVVNGERRPAVASLAPTVPEGDGEVRRTPDPAPNGWEHRLAGCLAM